MRSVFGFAVEDMSPDNLNENGFKPDRQHNLTASDIGEALVLANRWLEADGLRGEHAPAYSDYQVVSIRLIAPLDADPDLPETVPSEPK